MHANRENVTKFFFLNYRRVILRTIRRLSIAQRHARRNISKLFRKNILGLVIRSVP